MKKEEVVSKLKKAISETMIGSGLNPEEGVEAILNAAMGVIGVVGASLGVKPNDFIKEVVKQAYDQLNQE